MPAFGKPLLGRLLMALGILASLSIGGALRAEGWNDERLVGRFYCRANFPLSGYENLLKELARVQDDLTKVTGVPRAAEPVEMYLFDSQRAYRSYVESAFPQVPYRRALFVKGSGPGRVYVYRSGEMAVDMRHEGTHALLHAVLPMVPLWLDEGLAEYFELPAAQNGMAAGHRRRLNLKLLVGRPPRLADLEAKHDLADMTEADYSYSWAWTHFMLHGPPEAHDELVSFLRDIRQNTPPGVLSERLQQRLPDVENRFVHHFRTYGR